jgi:hypothetical protein
MEYQDYEDFIDHRMRMSHVYQPVMLMTLLKHCFKRDAISIPPRKIRGGHERVA